MVNIKGLGKVRVMKALTDEAVCFWRKIQHKWLPVDVEVDLSGDEFDERAYDEAFGEGAAQRAVDSVRAELKTGSDTAENADGEKKELSMEEKLNQTKKAIEKILGILHELPPDMYPPAAMCLKTILPGPMDGLAGILRGPFAPPFPFKGRFG